jgi:hypothetical protein
VRTTDGCTSKSNRCSQNYLWQQSLATLHETSSRMRITVGGANEELRALTDGTWNIRWIRRWETECSSRATATLSTWPMVGGLQTLWEGEQFAFTRRRRTIRRRGCRRCRRELVEPVWVEVLAGDVEQSSFSSLFGDSGVSSVPIGAKCQCKLVNWIRIRVRGGATLLARASASRWRHGCLNRK